jgi:hypothetical protein
MMLDPQPTLLEKNVIIREYSLVTCNCFTYRAEPRTGTYIKHITRDHSPASLLARRLDLQKTYHVITIHRCDVTADTEKTASSVVA